MDRALRGSLFSSNPKKTMQRMRLTPLHKPFGTDLTIIDFARAGSLKSVPHLEAWIRADEWKVGKTKQEQAKAAVAKKTRIKMVSVGDTAKGMTTLINHYVRDEHWDFDYEPTIGARYLEKVVNIEGHGEVKLEIWDSAGAYVHSFVIRFALHYGVQASSLLCSSFVCE